MNSQLLKEKALMFVRKSESVIQSLTDSVKQLNAALTETFPRTRFVLFVAPCNPYERLPLVATANDESAERAGPLPSSFTAQIAAVTAYKDDKGHFRKHSVVAVWTAKDALVIAADKLLTVAPRIVDKIVADPNLLADLVLADSASFGFSKGRYVPDATDAGLAFPSSYPYAFNQPLPSQDERSVLQD